MNAKKSFKTDTESTKSKCVSHRWIKVIAVAAIVLIIGAAYVCLKIAEKKENPLGRHQ